MAGVSWGDEPGVGREVLHLLRVGLRPRTGAEVHLRDSAVSHRDNMATRPGGCQITGKLSTGDLL